MSKVTKRLTIKEAKRIKNKTTKNEMLEEIGETLIEGILDAVSQQRTPVKGGSYKKGLSKKYAQEKGSNTANMELTGDMLDALEFRISGNTVEVGVFDEEEAKKVAGHHSGNTPWRGYKKSKLPPREFIPRPKQDFKREIKTVVNEIVEEYLASQNQE